MHCLKCGQKTGDSEVFCENCLEDMKKYPVKPGTVVRLPQRQPAPVNKKRPQKHLSFRKAIDQISMLRNRTRLLTAALIVTFLCFLAAAFLVLYLLEWHNYFTLPFIPSP